MKQHQWPGPWTPLPPDDNKVVAPYCLIRSRHIPVPEVAARTMKQRLWPSPWTPLPPDDNKVVAPYAGDGNGWTGGHGWP
ncbi:MAG: hypothetical protein K9N23_17690 [Akkermansiaceae bacterium]|nr:hypothetical protein [Akkermansiaceae bacterium]MCF7733526.1 hypothetical protein [Akkermansiaceae bacterium]